jgi:tetratricopeptide (TPR) repeat protein
MKQEMNYSWYVDRYLEGVMNDAERNWFEKELDGNKKLRTEMELQKKLSIAIADWKTTALQTQLDTIHKRLNGNKVSIFKISGTYRNIIYISSAIAASIAISFLAFSKSLNTHLSISELYAQYYKPAEISMSFRSTGKNMNNDLRSAMMLYENQKYVDAIQLFEKILKEDSSRIGLNLYSGISHMEIKQYNEANQKFKKIIDHKANAYIESAEWYLGLCYLMINKEEKAGKIFANIANNGSYYKKDARRILKKMN